MERYLTANQIADQLQVEPRTVRAWIQRGELKAVRAGRFWRVKESDLEAFLRASTQEVGRTHHGSNPTPDQ